MTSALSPTLSPLRHRTKGQALCAQITELALELGADAKLPTVLQLCAQLGVSVTTLNTVLAELESQKVIYRRHGVGIFVSPQLRQKCVGLVCAPNFFRPGISPFWQQLIEGVNGRAAAAGEGFRFYLAMPPARPELPVSEDLFDDVNAGRLHGVLMIGQADATTAWLGAQGVPVVNFAGDGPWSVQLDYATIVRIAVERLVAQDCRDLAIASPAEPDSFGKNALSLAPQGFVEELQQRALPAEKSWIWDASLALEAGAAPMPDTHQEQGYRAIMEMFGPKRVLEKMPQGLIITDDMMARGALSALNKLGVRPRKDVQIISHLNRDSMVLHEYEEELDFVIIDPAKVIRSVFETLEVLMNGENPSGPVVWVGPDHAN